MNLGISYCNVFEANSHDWFWNKKAIDRKSQSHLLSLEGKGLKVFSIYINPLEIPLNVSLYFCKTVQGFSILIPWRSLKHCFVSFSVRYLDYNIVRATLPPPTKKIQSLDTAYREESKTWRIGVIYRLIPKQLCWFSDKVTKLIQAIQSMNHCRKDVGIHHNFSQQSICCFP